MKLSVAGIIGACAAAVWLAFGQLSPAQAPGDIAQRTEQVKRELGSFAVAHSSQWGGRAVLPEDNMACLVCHTNFSDEEIAATHLEHGITCALCHGLCYEHMGDENNITPPDILYGRAEIGPLCGKCHGEHKNPQAVEQFLKQWEGKLRPNGQYLLREAVCTDCHGTHFKEPVRINAAEQ